jgi:predicted SAM-dependent methyltransferase
MSWKPFLAGVLVTVLIGTWVPLVWQRTVTPTATPPGERSWSPAEKQIAERYMAGPPPRKLQIGAGPNNLPGWLNSDIEPTREQIYLDATRPLPFPDGSLHYVYAEQLIEHISYDSTVRLLEECRRVLAPGGRVRLATPDLAQVVRLMDAKKIPVQQKLMEYLIRQHGAPRAATPECDTVNLFFRAWGHQFLYDAPSLRATLELAGFRSVTRHLLGESDDEHLRGVEMHWRIGGRDLDEYTSMFFEATRP